MGTSMRKHVAVFFFIAIGLLSSHIQIVRGLHKTYEWNEYGTYQVSLITSDSWQVDTTVNITFRLTLKSKGAFLDHTETTRVEMGLYKVLYDRTLLFIDSKEQWETKTLRNTGDYWEKNFSFYIPAEKVDRGQTLNVSIIFWVDYGEIDNVQWLNIGYLEDNSDNPMYVSLFRPFLSTLELIIIIAVVAVIVISGIIGLILHGRKNIPDPRSFIRRISPKEGSRLWFVIHTMNFAFYVALMGLLAFSPWIVLAFLFNINQMYPPNIVLNVFLLVAWLLYTVAIIILAAIIGYIRKR